MCRWCWIDGAPQHIVDECRIWFRNEQSLACATCDHSHVFKHPAWCKCPTWTQKPSPCKNWVASFDKTPAQVEIQLTPPDLRRLHDVR